MKSTSIIPIERIDRAILLIRGQRVMLDADLAALYGVSTGRLNQQVRRNVDRFPKDFAFALTRQEFANLKLQIATSSSGWGGRRKLPYVFTEHGAIMAANVLNSERAVKAGVYVVRAFVKLREMLSTHKDLARKLEELERQLNTHDHQIVALIDAIRQLMAPPPASKKPPVGFRTERGS